MDICVTTCFSIELVRSIMSKRKSCKGCQKSAWIMSCISSQSRPTELQRWACKLEVHCKYFPFWKKNLSEFTLLLKNNFKRNEEKDKVNILWCTDVWMDGWTDRCASRNSNLDWLVKRLYIGVKLDPIVVEKSWNLKITQLQEVWMKLICFWSHYIRKIK